MGDMPFMLEASGGGCTHQVDGACRCDADGQCDGIANISPDEPGRQILILMCRHYSDFVTSVLAFGVAFQTIGFRSNLRWTSDKVRRVTLGLVKASTTIAKRHSFASR